RGDRGGEGGGGEADREPAGEREAAGDQGGGHRDAAEGDDLDDAEGPARQADAERNPGPDGLRVGEGRPEAPLLPGRPRPRAPQVGPGPFRSIPAAPPVMVVGGRPTCPHRPREGRLMRWLALLAP